MTEISQPPGADGIPLEPPAAPPWPEPGFALPADLAGPGGDLAGAGLPATPPPRRRRTGLITGIVAAVVVLAGALIGVGVALEGSGASISLPGTLLGLPEYAGPGAQRLDASLTQESSKAQGRIVNVVASFYGNPYGAGPFFAVSGGGLCGTCAPGSASPIVNAAVAHGFADARSFPPGPRGGWLVCFSQGPDITCTWADPRTGCVIVYGNGLASGLADAAAKARQIRAVVEH